MQPSVIARFSRSKRGNIALLSALLAVPLLVLAGGAVDLMKIAGARSEVLGALDAGILAAASLTNPRDPETVIREYLDTNVDPTIIDPASITLNVTAEKTGRFSNIEVAANFNIDTDFVDVIGFHTVPVAVTSSATHGIANVEISLVLDVSGSMSGDKIAALRTDAANFVTEMLDASPADSTSISVVPYSSNVTLNKATFSNYLDKDSIDEDAIEDHLCESAGPGCSIDDFTDEEKEVAAVAVWNGCLEYESTDFDGSLLPFNGRNETASPNEDNGKDDCRPGVEPIFLSQNVTTLTNQIGSYVASGETAMHVATMWGYNALSDSWRGRLGGDAVFADRPTQLGGDEAYKILVVMTDGKINPHDADVSKAVAGNRFLAVCNAAKANDVSVWAIGFQIDEGGEADQLLSQCPNNASQYLLSGDSSLADEFDTIFESIAKLRVTS